MVIHSGRGNDVLIEQCLRIPDPEDARKAWGDLCQRIVWPTVEKVLKRKMGGCYGSKDDYEDEFRQVACEAFASVSSQFDSLAAGRVIQDLAGYTAVTTIRAFGHMLRRKYPERAQLQSEINHALKADPRLAKWVYQQIAAVTGIARWAGTAPVRNQKALSLVEQPEVACQSCFGVRDPATMMLPDALLHLYAWLTGPLELDPLVTFCKSALRRAEIEVGEETGFDPPEPPRGEEALTVKVILQALWDELAELESPRRGVFLVFEPPGSEQDHLLDLLVMNGIASLDEIADFVGLSLEQLIGLLRQDRVELKEVAELYGMDTKRAEGVRKGVLERLARRFEKQGLYRTFAQSMQEGAP